MIETGAETRGKQRKKGMPTKYFVSLSNIVMLAKLFTTSGLFASSETCISQCLRSAPYLECFAILQAQGG